MSEDLDEVDGSSSTEDVHSKATVTISVMIDGVELNWPLQSFYLSQGVFEHHELKLVYQFDLESMNVADTFSPASSIQNSMGKKIVVKLVPSDEYVGAGEKLEFLGVVTNISLANSAAIYNQIIIEAKSLTWLMDQTKLCKFYFEMEFADILSGILAEVQMEASASFDKKYSVKNEFQTQLLETNWEYMTTNYQIFPNFVYYDGTTLRIEPPKNRNLHTLEWQKHIGAISISLNVQASDFVAVTWDDKEKSEVMGKTRGSSTSFSTMTRAAYKASMENFSSPSFMWDAQNGTPKSVEQASSAAQGIAIGGLVKCQVQCNVPSIKVGDTIKFQGLSGEYDGIFYVTEITHEIDLGYDYYNNLVAVPLESANPSYHQREGKRIDPIPGIVTDNKDPEKRGRIKVQTYFQDKDGNPLVTSWCRMLSGYAGKGRGIYFVPEIGDEVLIAFEYGTLDSPIVLGALWNGKDKPAESCYSDNNDNNVMYSRSGHQVILCDADGAEYIKILDKTEKQSIMIDSKENSIAIASDKDWSVVSEGGNISLEAKDGDVSIKGKNIKIEAVEGMNLKAGSKGFEVKSDGDAKMTASMNASVEGAMTDVKSQGMLNIKADGMVIVKGAQIMLN